MATSKHTSPADGVVSLVPIPELGDDVETTARKMKDLAEIIDDGKSLAVCTGYAAAKNQERDPIQIATKTMSTPELDQYDAWVKGIEMPTFDWNANLEPVPGGANSIKRYKKHAMAMDIIWKHEGATPDNAAT
ncbi:hypothetical protein CDD82_954 [Ophiocordyceps australis]|uniref:Uncharacterized protein n=1 Tax=Ophiocordyceps australis TaxID=1399860 RepID=A0A2C5XPX8_9HYPO|nr:hypothetical protein CDD82_954 [Ophiocordyceps australis]